MEFKLSSITDEDVLRNMRDRPSVEVVRPIRTEDRKLWRWELFKRSSPCIMIVHIFPKAGMLKNKNDMLTLKAAVEEEVKLQLLNYGVLAEWIEEFDSFCISFLSTPDGEYQSVKFMNSVSENIKRRMF